MHLVRKAVCQITQQVGIEAQLQNELRFGGASKFGVDDLILMSTVRICARMDQEIRMANQVPATQSAGVISGPAVVAPHCGCNVQPWEHCEHTLEQ